MGEGKPQPSSRSATSEGSVSGTVRSGLLRIRGLTVAFQKDHRIVPAVEGLDFHLDAGEFLSIIGESGSGKTVTASAVMGLLDGQPGVIEGSIRFRGEELLTGLEGACRVEREGGEIVRVERSSTWSHDHQRLLRAIRGRRIGMIFQEPGLSLDPMFTVGEQLSETLVRWGVVSSEPAARVRAIEWLGRVSLREPAGVMSLYPHQLSGGMSQRVMIALALAPEPELLIADEPTTALDVTIQKEIMLLLQQLRRELNLTILFISHDLELVHHFADRIVVMHRGRIIESGTAQAIFSDGPSSAHPFTAQLLSAGEACQFIPAAMPVENESAVAGCRFYNRCPQRMDRCRQDDPPLVLTSGGRRIACWLHVQGRDSQH